jgi:nucleoside-diphosphate-sugar epimerase
LVRDLFAHGYDVRGLVRRETELGAGIETRRVADAAEAAERNGALDDVDVLVHLAARVHRTDEAGDDFLDRYVEDNATATRRLAIAASRAGVERLIFVSSVKVHGDDGERPCAEDDPTRPTDAYGISKLRAEKALAEVRTETGLATVVLRPPLIYGPEVKANFRTLLRLADTPLPLPLGGIEGNRRSYLFLGNLLSAVRKVLTEPAAVGRTYLVRDGEDVSSTALIARLRAVLGRPRRLVPVPAALISAAASITGRGAIVEPLTGSRRINDSRIRAELRWRPPYTLDQGLAATASWFRAHRAR